VNPVNPAQTWAGFLQDEKDDSKRGFGGVISAGGEDQLTKSGT
jgi:hypothetical protein